MRVLVLGSGRSGRAVADYLDSQGIGYEFARQEDIDAEKIDEKYLDDIISRFDFAVISPGISLQKSLVFRLKQRQFAFFGELEFGTSKINNDIIAVTGTNGKTTTVSLINYFLRGYVGGIIACGNIGVPVSSCINQIKGDEIIVLEASSFQLETITKFKPHIAVILNITQDHLNRHGTMKEYIKAKYNIAKNLTKDDYLILNADDEYLYNNPPDTKAKVFYFSTKQKVVGSYVKGKSIYFNDNKKEIKLANISKIKLKGEHNLSNILASVLAVYLETGNTALFDKLSLFEGVPHRIEFVKTVRGIEFYNDSKATNIASTLVAVSSFKKGVNLILGGSDKGYDFDELFIKLTSNVKNIAIFGENRNKIAFFAKKHNYKNYYICDGLLQSTRLLFSLSEPGDIVLLSPACASFDMFSGYEERGNFFKKIVRELDENEISGFEFKEESQT